MCGGSSPLLDSSLLGRIVLQYVLLGVSPAKTDGVPYFDGREDG